MPPIVQFRNKFDRTKAIEAILYLANRISNPTYLTISKLLYLADKTSLENYGRFIAEDIYCAMEKGPVPSGAYDLMKSASPEARIGFQVQHNHNIVPSRDANLEELSESDIECLERVLGKYAKASTTKLIEDSHDAAWEKAWASRGSKASILMPLESIAKLLSNADELIEHLATLHND